MSSTNRLKELMSSNQSDRLSKEKLQQDRITDPSLLRHTVYKGDRTIQQLGQAPIENGVILNNQSLAIGDVMLPLAKGNVLRRVDNTNGGALLGTAYRDALENDYDANGNRREALLSRNGGNEPSEASEPSNLNRPRRNPDRVPPPFGCTPPPSKCIWSRNPMAPEGFQSHGDAVVNENALPVYLHCMAGSTVPNNLNCGFLDPQRWSCSGGICLPNASGIYTSQAQCQAALIPPAFTGGQTTGASYTLHWRVYQTLYNYDPFIDESTRMDLSVVIGKIISINLVLLESGLNKLRVVHATGTGDFILNGFNGNTSNALTIEWLRLVLISGGTDTGGNSPSTCPV